MSQLPLPSALRRLARSDLGVDLVAVALLLLWGTRAWPDDVRPPSFGVESASDHLLYGPDAAAWASNAQAYAAGHFNELDFHRMPTFTIVIGTLVRLGAGVTEATHLWNRLSFWLLAPVLYGLGRVSGSRSAGFAAGLTIVCLPKLVESSQAAGVDPTVMFLLPTMLLVTALCARRWYLTPLSGALAALAAIAHLTTLPFVVPPVLLALVRGRPGWRRWAAAGLQLAGSALAGWLVFRVFPFPDKTQLIQVFQEGVQQGTVVGAAREDAGMVSSRLLANAPQGFHGALTYILQVAKLKGVPELAFGVLPWIGALGAFLRTPDGRARVLEEQVTGPRRAWRWLTNRTELAVGPVLLLSCTPLVVLAMANAPERYAFNLLPILLVLVWRGVASLCGAVDFAVTRYFPAWPTGALCAAVGVAAAGSYAQANAFELQPKQPPQDAVAAAAIGKTLAEMFPPGGGAAILLREAGIAAGRSYCPHSDCPRTQDEGELRRCMVVLDQECGGEGPIPYVIVSGPGVDRSRPNRGWMDDYVKGHWPPAKAMTSGPYNVEIYAIPRDQAKASMDSPG